MFITIKGLGVLFFFALSIIFVVCPFSIRLPFGRCKIRLRIGSTAIPIKAIFLLWTVQQFGSDAIRPGIDKSINRYKILFLFLSLSYLAIAIDISGFLQALVFACKSKWGWKLLFLPYIILFLVSILLGNDFSVPRETATVTYYTVSIADFNGKVLTGSYTNAAASGGFMVNHDKLTFYTTLPFFVWTILGFMVLVLSPKYYKSYIPERLRILDDMDTGKVFKDPIGIFIGFIFLGTCLLIIMIGRSFKIEASNISLSFAFVKFIVDVVWDLLKQGKDADAGPDVKILIMEDVLQVVSGSISNGGITESAQQTLSNLPFALYKLNISLDSTTHLVMVECAVKNGARIAVSLHSLSNIIICEGVREDNSISLTAYTIIPILASSATDAGNTTHKLIRDNLGDSDSIESGSDIVAHASVVVIGSCVVTVVVYYRNWRQKPTFIIQISDCTISYPTYTYYSGSFNGGNFGGGGIGGDGYQTHSASGGISKSTFNTDSEDGKLLREIEGLQEVLEAKMAAMKLRTLEAEVAALKIRLGKLDC